MEHTQIVSSKNKKYTQWLWDIWCTVSIIGIWPRFIEPNLLSITKLNLKIDNLPQELHGLKIVQFSDLHWNKKFSNYFKQKLISKINSLKADLVLFSGDFLSRSQLEDPEGLKTFLNSIQASTGHFAILGNHDYQQFVTVNSKGDYDIENDISHSVLGKGFKRLFSSVKASKKVTQRAKDLKQHHELLQILAQTPFKLLNNNSKLILFNRSFINLSGIGEYMVGQADVKRTFENYDQQYPGIILVHNPDVIPQLKSYPGSIVLAGHTHGGQVNLPWIWKKFTVMENQEFKQGLIKKDLKWCYVNRGVGSIMRFRWFAMPELTFITLQK